MVFFAVLQFITDPEVSKPHLAVSSHQNITGLHIPMDLVVLMEVLNSLESRFKQRGQQDRVPDAFGVAEPDQVEDTAALHVVLAEIDGVLLHKAEGVAD